MDNPRFKIIHFSSTSEKTPFVEYSQTLDCNDDSYCTYTISDLPKIHRGDRQDEAITFRHQYLYGPTMDRKTCIWSCDSESWLDKSSGIMWVGVRGMDSICVVSRTGDLDIKRLFSNLKKHTVESFLHHFRKTIIVELEDLEDPNGNFCPDFVDPLNKLRQSKCIKKPFGIVSVRTDEVDKESGHEVIIDEQDEFLKCKHMDELYAQKRIQEDMPYNLPTPAQHDEKDINETVQKDMPYNLPTPAQHDEKDINETVQKDMPYNLPTPTPAQHDEKGINETVQKDMPYNLPTPAQKHIQVNFDEEDDNLKCKRMRALNPQKHIQKDMPYNLPTPAQHDEKDINETVQKDMPYNLPTPAQHDEKDTNETVQKDMPYNLPTPAQHDEKDINETVQKDMPYNLPTPAQHDEKDISETAQVLYGEWEWERNKVVNRVLEAGKSIQMVDRYSLPTPAQHDEKDTIKFLQERMETDTAFTINETVPALEHDEKKAIRFLQKKMESGLAFTMDETIQAAISAFQHLFQKKFKANEIGVTVMDPAYNVRMHVEKCKDVNAKELEIHDIKKHLAVINGGSSSSRQPTVDSCEEDDEKIRV